MCRQITHRVLLQVRSSGGDHDVQEGAAGAADPGTTAVAENAVAVG